MAEEWALHGRYPENAFAQEAAVGLPPEATVGILPDGVKFGVLSGQPTALGKAATCLWIDGSKRAIQHARGVFDQDEMQGVTPLAPSYPELIGGPVTPGANTVGYVPGCIRPGGKLPLG